MQNHALRGVGLLPALLFLTISCGLDPMAGRQEPIAQKAHVGLIPGDFEVLDSDSSGEEEPPVILSLDPPRGSPVGGDSITLTGTGFSRDSAVYFGEVPSTEVYFINTKTLLVVTPPHTPGLVDVRVLLPSGLGAKLADGFLYAMEHAIHSITPGSGPVEGGTRVTVRGTGFLDDTVILVGQRTLINQQVVDSNTIIGLTPPGSVGGAVDVYSMNLAGKASLKKSFIFQVEPLITSLDPPIGEVAGGYQVHLKGRWLSTVERVQFGGEEAQILQKNPDRILVLVPQADREGGVVVRVEGRWGSAILPSGFTYVDPEQASGLRILGVHPGEGGTAGEDQVLLAVCGISGQAQVRFGQSQAQVEATHASDCRVEVLTPPHVPGQVDLEVKAGGATAALPGGFRYRAEFTASQVVPGDGPMSGGVPVTILGQGMDQVVAVRFGPLPATELVHEGDGVTVKLPPGPAGLVDVTLLAADGQVAILYDGFRYDPEHATLVMLEPDYGSQAGGTLVKALGAGFTPDSTLTFGSAKATEVEFKSPTELWVRTPRGNVGTVDVGLDTGEDQVTVKRFYSYFDPGSAMGGGTWGPAIDGSVNVTVFDSFNLEPLENAYVILGETASSPHQGRTDERGQITFSRPGLKGPVMVSAAKVAYDASSVVDFDAENISLFCYPDNPETSNNGEGTPPQNNPEPGSLRGKVSGLGKYVRIPAGSCLDLDWNPGEICSPCTNDGDCGQDLICAEVSGEGRFCSETCLVSSDCSDGFICGGLDDETYYCLPPAGEEAISCSVSSSYMSYSLQVVRPPVAAAGQQDYELESRIGEVAVVCLGGFITYGSGEFIPMAMGVKRHITVNPGQDILDQEIRLDIPLNRSLRLRMDDPPTFKEGQGRYQVNAYLDFGSDGIYRLPESLTSFSPEDIEFQHLPESLEGPLYDARYVIVASAFSETSDGTPSSTVVLDDLDFEKSAAIWSLDEEGWGPADAAPYVGINGLCSLPSGELLAVGLNGFMALRTGGYWVGQPALTELDLTACASGPDGDFWVVGEEGVLLRRTAGSWELLGNLTDRDLLALTVTEAGVLLAVGNQRIITRSPDGQLETLKLPYRMAGVAHRGAEAWAVGEAGKAFHWDGSHWNSFDEEYQTDFHTIGTLEDGHVVAAGDGRVWLLTESGWKDLYGPAANYAAVAGSSITNFWLASPEAGLIHKYGLVFEQSSVPNDLDLTALAMSQGQPFAAGMPALLFTPFLHFVNMQIPAEGWIWNRKDIVWNNSGGPEPSFYLFNLSEMSGDSIWQLMVKGTRRAIVLPDFQQAAGIPALPQGGKRMWIYGAFSETFSIDKFSWWDLSLDQWRSWTYDFFEFDQ